MTSAIRSRQTRARREGRERLRKCPAAIRAPIIISGRVQKPLATVEVARVEPKLTLADVRRSFTERIERPVAHDPY